MDVKAILLLGTSAEPNPRDSMGGVPLSLLDVLGKPVLLHTVERLWKYGVSRITAIGDPGVLATHFAARGQRTEIDWVAAAGAALWKEAQRVFTDYARAGTDLVIVIHLGPYCEVDFDQLIQSHLQQNAQVTAVKDDQNRFLETFVISAWRRNDAAFLLRHRLQESRNPVAGFLLRGYYNPMSSVSDLRRLAVDTFCGRTQILPDGAEFKPGVWLGTGARICRGARVLAPAFIGQQARVDASAVITRCSVLEHHTHVGCGTIVEDSTILPYTGIGTGLDIAQAVVGFSRVASLRRHVEVAITDPKLVSSLPAPGWIAGHAASLLASRPLEFMRDLLGRRGRAREDLPAATEELPSASLPAESLSATDPALSNYR